jgi:hypothetical protein
LSLDHGDTQPPREDLGELIEDLIEAESSLLSAQTVMLDPSLAHRSGYESIVEHISGALGSAQMALAELHHMFHESRRSLLLKTSARNETVILGGLRCCLLSSQRVLSFRRNPSLGYGGKSREQVPLKVLDCWRGHVSSLVGGKKNQL